MSIVRTIQPPLNKALYFDGVDDYVEVPHSDSLTVSYELTAIAWVSIAVPSPDQKVIGKSSASDGWVMGVMANAIYPEVWDSTKTRYVFVAGRINANEWTFLAITWKTGGRYKCYINGAVVNDVPASNNPIGYSTRPLTIGRAPWHPVFFSKCYIAQVLVYSHALSDSEIQWNYNNPNKPVGDGLVLWLDARACDSTKNICYDLSGNDNHGTIYGAQVVTLPSPVRAGGRL